jgi:hypothetical protein
MCKSVTVGELFATDNRSLTEKMDDHSKQDNFEHALNGIQYQLRQARIAMLAAGMKMQDTDRPEIEVDDFRLYDTAVEAIQNLQARIRDILADLNPNAPIPSERQLRTDQV